MSENTDITLREAIESGMVKNNEYVNLIIAESYIINPIVINGDTFNIQGLHGRGVFMRPLKIEDYMYSISYGYIIHK